MPSPEARRALTAGAVLAIGAGLLAYPLLLEPLLHRAGVRATALALLGGAGVGLVLSAPPLAGVRLPRWPRWGMAGLLVLTVLSGHRGFLLWVPVFVYLGLAAFFEASLRGGDSLIHFLVRRTLPEAPDFVAPYCRVLTRVWAGVFLGCALFVAALAGWSSVAAWRAWTGWGLYALLLGLSAVEFLVRKTWFRYYFRGGPFDRFWSRLFPAEATPRGRRSAEAIRRYRAANPKADAKPG